MNSTAWHQQVFMHAYLHTRDDRPGQGVVQLAQTVFFPVQIGPDTGFHFMPGDSDYPAMAVFFFAEVRAWRYHEIGDGVYAEIEADNRAHQEEMRRLREERHHAE